MSDKSVARPGRGRDALAMGVIAWFAVLLTLGAPGVTIDEPLDVRPGRTYIETLSSKGLWGFLERETVDRVFRDNAEHPPLGRWLLGIASKCGEPFEIAIKGGPDAVGIYVLSGRLAPAAAFAWLVGLVTWETGRRFGRSAGISAGISLIAMPRLFSHAHLGALDMFVALFWVNAYLSFERATDSKKPMLRAIPAGVAWGLILLTKIHGWLLPPIIVIRAISKLGFKRASAFLLIWSLVGFGLFVVFWPWLWYDSVARFARFLGTGVERISISVTYFGRIYQDRQVPWHYPWFYFAVTVPAGLHLFGVIGLWESVRERRSDPFGVSVAAVIACLLGLFSTDVPVYDGERLYLLVFPLWAILIGRGFSIVKERVNAQPWKRRGLNAFLAAQFLGLAVIYPFGLSYHNILVGGLPGAEKLGLELTYWTDTVDSVLLDRVAREASPNLPAALVPTLAPQQGRILTTRAMARKPVILEDQERAGEADLVVVHRRESYWRPEVRSILDTGDVLLRRSRQGVWLSALVRKGKPSGPTGIAVKVP